MMPRLKFYGSILCFTIFLAAFISPAFAGDPVPFSGMVKKVLEKKNKVSIQDPETKKRFTVVIDDQTKLSGYGGIGEINKGDSVSGQYVVTDKGLYIATELAKK